MGDTAKVKTGKNKTTDLLKEYSGGEETGANSKICSNAM